MRVYVAGASAEIERAEALIARLRDAGVEVISDWPENVRRAGAANIGLTHEVRLAAARACSLGVRRSDWLVVLEPKAPTIGAWVEMGIALAQGIDVLWVGEGDCTVFESLATSTVSSDDEAFRFIAEACRE